MVSPEADNSGPSAELPPDDDGDLELEPPDETIEVRQRQIALEAIRSNIDIDAIYREADRDYGSDLIDRWMRNFRFRFQVKHLLIATAVLSIVLTLIRLKLFWTTLVVGVMLSIGGLYLYLRWEERKQQAEAERRREAMYARRRAQMAATMAGQPSVADMAPGLEATPLPNAVDEIWQESLAREKFRLRFSLRELLLLVMVAAVMLGMIRFFGGPEATASMLGMLALAGLVLYAVGYEPPQLVILAWWVILAMYVVVSMMAVVWSVFA